MSKKLFAVIFAVMIIFCGCEKPAVSDNAEDYGHVDGYYSQLAYEVKNDDGAITELMYFLCTDEELVNAVGRKDVHFDVETGEVTGYTVNIGVEKPEKIINYAVTENDIYYSEMYFNDEGQIERSSWENHYLKAEGGEVKEVGSEEYYDNGVKKKSEYTRYQGGEVIETSLTEYDESGNVING